MTPTDVMSTKETGAAPVDIEVPAEVATVVAPRQKPRRLISLQYNYSDSEEDESREERKARIVSPHSFLQVSSGDCFTTIKNS